jgi:hypothetical protein
MLLQRALPILVAVMSLGATACASTGGYYRYPTTVRSVDERAYARGYDEGRSRGQADARSNRRFDYQRHGSYRDADDGYRGYGDRREYRTLFRQGFVAGYNDGYRRNARQAYGYPGRTYPGSYPGVPPRFPGAAISAASQNGYRDGYEQGRDDARDRDRFDPIRASRYRSGDHDYERRYGSREDYKREYRAAFQQGYSQGYREYQR